MIDEKMTERMVACGWVAAALSALLTLLLVAMGTIPFLSLIDAAVLGTLAWGIYRRSRICAILALSYHVLNRLFIYTHAAGAVPPVSIAGDLLLFVLYVLGVVGTFLHHARNYGRSA